MGYDQTVAISGFIPGWVRVRAPLIALCALAAVTLVVWLHSGLEGSPESTVTSLVTGSFGDPVIVQTGDGALGFTAAAARVGGLDDLWVVPMQVSPSGHPYRVGYPRNLSKTAGAAERIVGRSGTVVLVAVEVRGKAVSLTALDAAGENPALTSSWGDLEQKQARVTRWQATGQANGVGWQRLVFPEPIARFDATPAAPGTFRLTADGAPLGAVTFAERFEQPPRVTWVSGETLSVEEQSRGRTGHLGWVVDTVRDTPFVGSAKIAILEDIAFTVLDDLKRQRQELEDPAHVQAPGLMAEDEPAEAWHVASEDLDDAALRVVGDARKGRVWPPRAATPKVDPPGPGEGEWKAVTALVRPSDDGVPYLYQSWIRPDPSRRYARVSVTAFDPDRVALGVVAGTREPESTTGLKGSGRIPRRPGLLPRVVAAFNGGFQSKHGPYGLVEEDKVLVPPAGDAATVASTRDGRVLLGTWPATGPSPGWKSLAPGAERPKSVWSLRQNLQALVADGKVNPGRRKKWGSVAGKHIKDNTHTVRTGICLLSGGGVAYFFGPSLSAETLGQAMLDFHCDYGVHLDMNSGHSGFEFYRIQDDEGEKFEAARMIKDMWHMNFPRYIGRDARDYFYLRLRESPREELDALTGLSWKGVGARAGAPVQVLQSGSWYRLPAARTTATVAAPEPLPHGALLVPVAQGDASVTIAGTEVRVTDKPAAFTVVGHAPDHVFVAAVDDPEAAEKLLAAWGCTEVVTIPRPEGAAPVVRLRDDNDVETIRGGPLNRDAQVLAFSVGHGIPASGRLEDLFPAAD